MAKEPTRKPRESKVDPDESKADKFIRLAKARMTKALKAIAQLENLGGSNYEYTHDQANKIVNSLERAVAAVEAKLTATAGKKEEINFDFS